MQKIITTLLVVVGVIHLIPLLGVLGIKQLSSLYGLSFQESNISILMRHRSVLFGVFGLFFIFSAFNKQYQPLAFVSGFVSVVSFIALSWLTGNYNEAIHKVVVADIIALICLVTAVALFIVSSRKS